MGEIDIDLENNDIEVYKEVVKEEKPLKKKKKEVTSYDSTNSENIEEVKS